jgi:hypothetical protein
MTSSSPPWLRHQAPPCIVGDDFATHLSWCRLHLQLSQMLLQSMFDTVLPLGCMRLQHHYSPPPTRSPLSLPLLLWCLSSLRTVL